MRNDRTIGTLVERIADGDVEPTGVVKFQLFNERGRVVDEEVRPNFIAKTWKAHARAVLRQRWMQFGYNKQFTGQSTAGNDSMFPAGWASAPIHPADAICCWNDTTAEDATNEHTPNIPATGIIAYATRWPFASPTGKRGSVDVSNSFVDDDTVRHIFDWTTAQGNGTFQSVGWLRMGAPGIHLLSGGTQHRARTSITWTPATHIATATGLFASAPFVDRSTGTAYLAFRRDSTSGILRVVSFPAGTPLDDSSGVSIVGSKALDTQALTNVSSEFTPTSSASTGTGHTVMGRVTGATVVSYPTNQTSAGNTHRWCVVNDGTATNSSYAFPTTGFIRGCVIGTTLYAGAGGTSSIYQLNTATGATINTIAIDASVTALCTLAGITTPRPVAFTTDGTDLFVAYGQNHGTTASKVVLVRLNTSGVLQQIMGAVPHSQSSSFLTETTGAPFAGTHYFPNGWWNAEHSYGGLTTDASTATSTTEDAPLNVNMAVNGDQTAGIPWNADSIASGSAVGGLHYYDGSLFFSNWTFTTTVGGLITWYRQGFDLGSRVLLGSSKVKSAAQTMKITYDITLPGWL